MNRDLIQRMRAFNRYYTIWLEVLNKDYLETELSWPEARVLFEIYLCQTISATEVCGRLNMDKSYVSRIISRFEKQGLVTRELIPGSKGVKKIRLTERGTREAERIDRGGDRQLIGKLKNMDEETCRKLCEAMDFIEKTLRENDRKDGDKHEA